MVSRPVAAVLLAGCLLPPATGCSSEPDSGPRPTVVLPTFTLSPQTRAPTGSLADLEQALFPSPQGVTAGLNALGAAPRFQTYEVTTLAVQLCEQGYDASVVRETLRRRLLVRTSALTVPAARLLGLAQAQCSRTATVAESEAYHQEVAALRNVGTALPAEGTGLLSSTAQKNVCAVLGSSVGNAVLEGVVTDVIGALTRVRGRFAEPSDVLALVVEAATGTCPLWLAPASRALAAAS